MANKTNITENPAPKRGTPHGDALRARIVEFVRLRTATGRGPTVSEIADKFGLSKSGAQYHIGFLGLQRETNAPGYRIVEEAADAAS